MFMFWIGVCIGIHVIISIFHIRVLYIQCIKNKDMWSDFLGLSILFCLPIYCEMIFICTIGDYIEEKLNKPM